VRRHRPGRKSERRTRGDRGAPAFRHPYAYVQTYENDSDVVVGMASAEWTGDGGARSRLDRRRRRHRALGIGYGWFVARAA